MSTQCRGLGLERDPPNPTLHPPNNGREREERERERDREREKEVVGKRERWRDKSE